MKKLILTFLLIVCISVTAEAKTYCLFDKETGEGKGTVSIKEEYVADWAKDFILKEGGEKYKGLQGHEIKLEGGKLRKATKKEIKDYLAQQKAQQEQIDIERLLKLLEREDIRKKIEKIKNP